MVKSYSQKLRVLYVMQILLRYSDEEHPISQTEISERLNAYGIQADRPQEMLLCILPFGWSACLPSV